MSHKGKWTAPEALPERARWTPEDSETAAQATYERMSPGEKMPAKKTETNEQYDAVLALLADPLFGNARCAWTTKVGTGRSGFRLEGWISRAREEVIVLQVFDHGVEIYTPEGVPDDFKNLAFWMASKSRKAHP